MATIDRDLLERARQYDGQALAEIYDQYAGSIYRYLYRLLGDAEQAEDLTSDVFLKLLQVLNTSRAPRDSLQGWLYRVARNLAMDSFRQQARGPTTALDEELIVGGESPASEAEKNHLRRQIRQAVAQLSEGQQQVILLRFGEGLKIEEVSRLLGKSEGAIKLLQYRAVQQLKKLLERGEKRVDEKESRRNVRGVAAASSTGRKH